MILIYIISRNMIIIVTVHTFSKGKNVSAQIFLALLSYVLFTLNDSFEMQDSIPTPINISTKLICSIIIFKQMRTFFHLS